eukprot:g32446.t1
MKREPEKQVLVTAPQSEESESESFDFDVPQSKLNNEQVLRNSDRIASYLSQEQRTELKGLLQKYEDICENRMGRTSALMYEVEVGNAVPKKHHTYRLNPLEATLVQKEVEAMLQEDIIELHQSEWTSPIMLVPKPDGTRWFYMDYWKDNAISKSDSYPIPRLEVCVENVGQATYFTKLDLVRGYWQVPLSQRTKKVSAFSWKDDIEEHKDEGQQGISKTILKER